MRLHIVVKPFRCEYSYLTQCVLLVHIVSYLFHNLKKTLRTVFIFNYRLTGIFSELHKIAFNSHIFYSTHLPNMVNSCCNNFNFTTFIEIYYFSTSFFLQNDERRHMYSNSMSLQYHIV